jgi:hypothetical protein
MKKRKKNGNTEKTEKDRKTRIKMIDKTEGQRDREMNNE